MNPAAARASVILLSFVILGLSALVTSFVWTSLSFLQPLPRGTLSLVTWVSAYYVATNLVFWRAVLRISATSLTQKT